MANNFCTDKEPYSYTVTQLSKILQLCPATVRKIIKENNIPTVQGTKNIRVTRNNFIIYFQTNQVIS